MCVKWRRGVCHEVWFFVTFNIGMYYIYAANSLGSYFVCAKRKAFVTSLYIATRCAGFASINIEFFFVLLLVVFIARASTRINSLRCDFFCNDVAIVLSYMKYRSMKSIYIAWRAQNAHTISRLNSIRGYLKKNRYQWVDDDLGMVCEFVRAKMF